jgi:hypothetical protein
VLEREGIVSDHAKKSSNTPKKESESANQRRTDNTMANKRTKGQRTIYKTLHRKLKINQNEPD